MATTAEKLREEIEEYLDTRIRPKSPDDLTRRETVILEGLQAVSTMLLQQARAKQSQQRSALGSLADVKVADLLRTYNAGIQLGSHVEEDEEE